MKVIIAGSRNFSNFNIICATMDELKKTMNIEEVVCGGCKGPDMLGKRWGETRGIPVKMFEAEWDTYGKAAGPIRNHKMGDYADFLVAFWDGKSKGTKDMIDYMRNIKKHGKVVLFNG